LLLIEILEHKSNESLSPCK